MQYQTNGGLNLKARLGTIIKWLPFVVAAALAVKAGSVNPAKMIECLGSSVTTTPVSPSSSADTSAATEGGDTI